MTSKAERRRRKISLPGGGIVEQRPTGRDRSHTNQPAEDARKTALEARCRIAGIKPTEQAMKDAQSQLMGCSVGRMLTGLFNPETRTALWQAAQHARKAQLAYDRAIGAPTRHATVARILAPTEAMSADAASPAPDTRTPEEKVRQSTSGQMQVEGWIGHCDGRAISAFKQAVINDPDGPVPDREGVLNCLHCIKEGLAGVKVKARVRR